MKRTTAFAVAVSITVLGVSSLGHTAECKAVYDAKCKSCHGADGKGTIPTAKTSNLKKDCIKSTTDGKGKMPAYK
ncbi:MAG: cytochrome c, partial [Deltaproteobacteria bacterium]|nr:cytochrome c [Deltaproteobacteria bacterium]